METIGKAGKPLLGTAAYRRICRCKPPSPPTVAQHRCIGVNEAECESSRARRAA